ncbi:hypothetical protein NKR23_g3003 [Pleurostoma richardsiae]|uniref:Uncharacterized protein n=1 Tax=Pleurostoma richardsiae TaxID=41990 RepID=A0AA38S195_9PEZI|nr:hypothetical protein NKR23_g3003 [Pleurostoma richardsiae]
MCFYIQPIPLCGHPPPTLVSYASCTALLVQLQRIDSDPSAWEAGGLGAVPFEVPAGCDPSPENTYVVRTGGYCGWECWNNHAAPAARGMGMPGARYGLGSERIGVGWREGRWRRVP